MVVLDTHLDWRFAKNVRAPLGFACYAYLTFF
jgi:hypothetical protein